MTNSNEICDVPLTPPQLPVVFCIPGTHGPHLTCQGGQCECLDIDSASKARPG